MKKHGHIIFKPNYAVGDKVIGLCGKKFTVEVLWEGIPKKHPICRPCVEVAVRALKDANLMVEATRSNLLAMAQNFNTVVDELAGESALDELISASADYAAEIKAEDEAKELEEKAAKTCTCSWETEKLFVADPECPIHGTQDGDEEGELDAIGVVFSEDQEEDK